MRRSRPAVADEKRALLIQRLSRLIPSGSRLLRIVWPLLAVVALLALLGTTSIDILSSVRAYVAGEGLWSKAQKESVYHLYRYAETRAESDYRRYQEAIAVPLGDRRAREELEKPRPDKIEGSGGSQGPAGDLEPSPTSLPAPERGGRGRHPGCRCREDLP